MNSPNLSEAQNNPQNFKTTGCNQSPIGCSCCGSKYYMQYLPQPCCLRTHHPETNKCKDAQEFVQENIKNPQPGFPPFPYIHPFFHNSLVPINPCYVHNHLNDPTKNGENKCGNEYCVSHLSNQERNESRENNETQDEAQKYVPRSESPFLGHPFNLMDPHFKSFFPPTCWADFMPWNCCPFFASMMSYCLFWNSHKFAADACFKNCQCNLGETDCSNKNKNQALVNENKDNKEIGESDVKSFSPEVCLELEGNNDQSMENTEKEEESVGCANSDSGEEGEEEVEEFGTIEEEEECVECVKPNADIIFKEEEGSVTEEVGTIEKGKEVVTCEKKSSDSISGKDEEDAETSGFDSAVQGESNEHFETNEKDLLKYSTCFSTEVEDSESSQPPGESEISYLMARQISENTVDSSASENQVNLSEALPAEEVFLQNLASQSGKPKLVTNTENDQERVPFKKTFKNFTIADQTKHNFLNEAQISVAAAGDLGGENCVGYKVTIVPFEKDENQVSPQAKPFEYPQKDSELKDPKCLQKNNLGNSIENSNEKPKCMPIARTRIAKLLNNSKSKESKTDTLKHSKQNVQSNQKEANFMRYKHNCLFNDNNNNNSNNNSYNNSSNDNSNNNINNNKKVLSANERALKIQKTKNCTVAEQQIEGPKKNNRERNLKNKSNKNEKKLQRLKF